MVDFRLIPLESLNDDLLDIHTDDLVCKIAASSFKCRSIALSARLSAPDHSLIVSAECKIGVDRSWKVMFMRERAWTRLDFIRRFAGGLEPQFCQWLCI